MEQPVSERDRRAYAVARLGVARTFREKKLPCDSLVYLGTEFAPSGWNTRNGEFTWHPTNFPDPKAMMDALHEYGYAPPDRGIKEDAREQSVDLVFQFLTQGERHGITSALRRLLHARRRALFP